MQRIYLFVSPEEKAEAQASGALWDDDTKRWYIDHDQNDAAFARWLPGTEKLATLEEEAFAIVSSQAYVAAASIPCPSCDATVEVICIHCDEGTVGDEPLRRFTVSHVWAMDEELARQLRLWPHFRKTGPSGDEWFANHCPNCNALQDDLYLHSEPGDPFFDIPGAAPGLVKLTPLVGSVRLNGDEHFQVD